MALLEDPTIFLADFGVSVTADAVSGVGIFDMPGEAILDGMVISREYSLRCEASKFGALGFGASVLVGTGSYEVRENRLLDDGVFCLITLSKVEGGAGAAGNSITTLSGLRLITQDGRYLVTL
jgi:hypothetical protein